jgi:hypothetical protein
MPIIKDNFTLTIHKGIPEIKGILSKNTLKKPFRALIGRERTDKVLIGKIQDENFSVIGSSPIGVICKLDGKFQFVSHEQTLIKIETSIQKAFTVLFAIWVIIISALAIFLPYLTNAKSTFSIFSLLLVVIVAFCFRLFLHIVYIISRNKAIEKVEDLMS